MSNNSFGKVFNFCTWGESHGIAIGCVVDGVPSNIELNESDIQHYLNERKPGQSEFTTQRQESDQVQILSGVFEGKTTGTPISLIIYNQDQKSKDYSTIKDKFRPGHADYTYYHKYGNRDYRGGGRSSARETAMRVAAGAIARKILDPNIIITGGLVQIGEHKINYSNWDASEIRENPFFSPDKEIIPIWEQYIKEIRKNGSSIGAVVEIRVQNLSIGLGEPIYHKLDSDLARALMSINAVKGVEIGNGFEAVTNDGVQNADEIRLDSSGTVKFSNNNAGGILGGISNGDELVVRFVVKPTSSILKNLKTIDIYNNETEIETKGRHDPCVGIRAVPVGEAMVACVLADHVLRYNSYKNQ